MNIQKLRELSNIAVVSISLLLMALPNLLGMFLLYLLGGELHLQRPESFDFFTGLILSPAVETFIFQTCLLVIVIHYLKNKIMAALIIAVIFGMFHLVGSAYNLGNIINITFGGFILNIVYISREHYKFSQKNFIVWVVHLLHNFFGLSIAYLFAR